MASIVSAQNSEENLRLLKASSQMYGQAKRISAWRMAGDLMVPLSSAIIGMFFPQMTVALAIVGGAWLIVVRFGLAHWGADLIEQAATIEEQFDVGLFGIPWDMSQAGAPLTPESISLASRRYGGDVGVLRDWYPDPGDVPYPFNVLLLQRSNLASDWVIRSEFASVELLGMAALIGAGVLLAWLGGFTTLQWLLRLAVPSLSFVADMTESARDNKKLASDRRRMEEDLRQAVDRMLRNPLSESPDLCRDIQNRILKMRKSTALVPNWWSKRYRERLNPDMTAATEELRKHIIEGLHRSGTSPGSSLSLSGADRGSE